jgi:hypothetical protein
MWLVMVGLGLSGRCLDHSLHRHHPLVVVTAVLAALVAAAPTCYWPAPSAFSQRRIAVDYNEVCCAIVLHHCLLPGSC